MVLMIDNFDSFTYNVVDLLRRTGCRVEVRRSSGVTLDEIAALAPEAIVISPGPGRPEDAGISLATVRKFARSIPILGICLGHQVIVEAFGGRIVQAPTIMHGKADTVSHDSQGLFRNIPQNLPVVRYHSLAADWGSVPDELDITARALSDQTVMGVRHRALQVEGVQFHPESIGTEYGLKIIQNFLSYRRGESPITAAIKLLAEGRDLDGEKAYGIMDEITDGELSDGQIGAFVGTLAVKGVTPVELSSFARVLIEKAAVAPAGEGVLDTCGTGGDGKHTFNISTAAALVCAAGGVTVAKHGNKAVSSKSGSYDFLRALGIPVGLSYSEVLASLRRNGFAFLFAPIFHSAMKHVARVRQELGTRTVFNMIGPLVNPVRPDYQLAGVYSEELLDRYAAAMQLLGVKRGIVVSSVDGLDEISIAEVTSFRMFDEQGEIVPGKIDPRDFGIEGFTLQDIEGGNAEENAAMFLDLLSGRKERGGRSLEPLICAVALNAAAGLLTAGSVNHLGEGYAAARTLLCSGSTRDLIERLRNTSDD